MSARSGVEISPAGEVLTTASGRRLKVPVHLAAALRQSRLASPRVTAGTRRGAAADGTPASPSFGTAFPTSPPEPLAAGKARAGTAGQKESAPGRPPLPPKRASAPQPECAGKAAAAPRRKSGAEVPTAATLNSRWILLRRAGLRLRRAKTRRSAKSTARATSRSAQRWCVLRGASPPALRAANKRAIACADGRAAAQRLRPATAGA